MSKYLRSQTGSSAGLKNWVKNPDAELGVAVDVSFGAGVVEPTQAANALVGLVSFAVTSVATASATTWWQWACNTIDSFFVGKPLHFSVKTSVATASVFRVSIYNVTDATELVETRVTIPGGFYEAKGFFIPVAGKSYGVRITQILNGAGTALTVDDVFVGDEPVRYGQAQTDWVAWTPTGSWTSNVTYNGQYRRNGDSILCQVKISLSGVPTSSSLTINVPSGLSIDTTKMLPNVSHSIGVGTLLESGVQNRTCSAAYTGSSSSISVMVQGSGGAYTNDLSAVNSTNPHAWKAGDNIAVEFSVPIVGWSSNIQIADRALEEYASNSNSTNTTSDTTSFAYGMAGSLIPNGAAGTEYSRTIRWQTAYQATDTLIIEVDQGSGSWIDIEKRLGTFVAINFNVYGVVIAPSVGSTDTVVTFNKGGRSAFNAATLGANGAPWSELAAWKWRVRKTSSGAQVGFPISSANIVGRTDGLAPAAGMVGEKLFFPFSGITIDTAGVNCTSFSLPAGNWSIRLHGDAVKGSSTRLQMSISKTSLTLDVSQNGDTWIDSSLEVSGAIMFSLTRDIGLNLSVATTIYIVGRSTAATVTSARGIVVATRVS